jgi:hypothetical protein
LLIFQEIEVIDAGETSILVGAVHTAWQIGAAGASTV